MSISDRPEIAAFAELEALVRGLGEELASFRRRALLAEASLKELESSPGSGAVQPRLSERLSKLERENKALKVKLETAQEKAKTMLDRVHFVRQQAQSRSE